MLLAVGLGCALAQAPMSPLGGDAPASEFSAARALEHIEAISTEPRPIGSPAHAEAREYLVAELEALGWNAEVQETVGVSKAAPNRTQRVGLLKNIVATLPGSDSSGTVILAAHYDSVDGSPGAADDGIGVGTIIETARALGADESTDGGQHRNDLMILLTDGEESGLLGAEAFVYEHAEELGATVLLNLEARGAAGSPVTFRTSTPNGVLVASLSQAGGVANSAMEAAFKLLSNDTDFSRFAPAGIQGVDSAIVGGGAFYHSPLDSPENLSQASLQQMGHTTLAMSREFLDADIATVAKADNEVVTTVPWGLWTYPLALELPLAIAGLFLAGGLLTLQRIRRQVTLPRGIISFLLGFVSIAAGAVAAWLVWNIASGIDPGQASIAVGEPYAPGLYQAAMLVAAAGTVIGIYRLTRRWLGPAAIASGALFALSVTGVALSIALPGAASALVIPTLFAAGGGLLAALLPKRWTTARAIALVAGLAVPAALLIPVVSIVLDLGLELGGPASAAFLSIIVLLALPLIELAWPMRATRSGLLRRLLPPLLVIALVAGLTAGGLFVNREGNTLPRQESLSYVLDTDSGEARWLSGVAPGNEWSRSLMPDAGATLQADYPWLTVAKRYSGEAPAADFDAPEVEVVSDETSSGGREITLLLRSVRDAPAIGLWLAAGGATITEATINGRELSLDAASEAWGFGVVVEGVPEEGVELRLLIDSADAPLELRVADRSAQLGELAGFVAPPQNRVLAQPSVWVSRGLTI